LTKGALPEGLRRARLADIASMSDLLGELFGIETDFETRPERQRAGLRALLRGKGRHAIVAEEDGAVVGMATLQVLVSTAEGGPVGLVEDVIVCSHYRGRGIGGKLIAGLEGIARREGLLRLQLLADERNAPAARFYGGSGWTMTNMRAWKKLTRNC
jgi:GNAT superfamily N-acetyltransferase